MDAIRRVVVPLARLGYAAKGVIYLTVGVLALRAALGLAEDNFVDREEALLSILSGAFGQILLVIIAVGLAGYAAGHLLMALRSSEEEDREGLGGTVNRLAHAGSSVLNAGLALSTLQLVLGLRDWRRGTGGPEDWTREIMAEPLGRWVIAGAGVAIFGIAIYQLHKAYTGRFRKVFREHAMTRFTLAQMVWIGRLGYVARALVYALIGYFLLQAAWYYDADRVGGMGEALVALGDLRFGPQLLLLAAIGLLAYGLYGVLLGKYRDFRL